MRRHLTYANVCATLALFFALAGGSYAATTLLPKNSVGSKQIRKNAVTGRAIKDNSVKGADVDESSLGKVPSAKSADAATTAKLASNAVTATSATTATHATSADSATHASTADTATNATTAANATSVGGMSGAALKLRCPAGTRPKWGACLELAAHPAATPPDALQDCSSRGGRLPTFLELTWVREQSDITWAAGTGSNQYEQTGDVLDPTNQETISLDQTGNVFSTLPTTTFTYRCVLSMVNG